MKSLTMFLWLAFASTIGCATIYSKFTKTGSYEAKAREPNCEFTIYTTTPDRPAKEIGLLEFEHEISAHRNDHGVAIDEIKNATREKVCAAGGNGLLLRATDVNGNFISGTVIWIE